MPADPEQELDGNVMPLSACLAAVTKHENGICLGLVADTDNLSESELSVFFQAPLVLMLFPISGPSMIEIYQSLPPSPHLMASDQYKRNLSIQLAI